MRLNPWSAATSAKRERCSERPNYHWFENSLPERPRQWTRPTWGLLWLGPSSRMISRFHATCSRGRLTVWAEPAKWPHLLNGRRLVQNSYRAAIELSASEP